MAQLIRIFFKDFQLFSIVYGIVFVDAGVAIVFAYLDKELDWKCLPNYIKKAIKYTGFLVFGNLADYVAQMDNSGGLTMMGIIPVFVTIVIVEIGSFRKKFLNT